MKMTANPPASPHSLLSWEGTSYEVAHDLGLAHADPVLIPKGWLPFAIHHALTKTDSSEVQASFKEFTANGRSFAWLCSSTPDSLWEKVHLDGLKIIDPDRDVRRLVFESIGFLNKRDWAGGLFDKYVATLVFVDKADSSARLITSCSLPDYPTAVFFSARMFRHIPPLTIIDHLSARLGAENLYHEAVHQAVNHILLTMNIFPPSYHSATSPRIPISWREDDREARNQSWELDRVLHAACVYAHLIRWRVEELSDPIMPDVERVAYGEALRAAVPALQCLLAALKEYEGHFAPAGVRFVERLTEFAEHHIRNVTRERS